ncbi:MAG: hypothetical protein M3N16_00350 [Actinomycetota bacterium]|nr:hypothetical protein [Actinomycetota bacterium]
MRLAAPGAALLATAALTACGEDRRERIEDYLKEVNAIQERSRPEFDRANRAYLRFSRGRDDPTRRVADFRRAEAALGSARGVLARVEPPPEARTLHRRLLRFFDLNLGLAAETTALGRYAPAVARTLRALPKASRRLPRSIGDSGTAGQERAFWRYAAALDRVAEELRRLSPPPVLAGPHRAQIKRLRATSTLARRLGEAIRTRATATAARLVLRFRRLSSTARPSRAIATRSTAAYNRRHKAIARASADVHRARLELERALR